jgi:hypothetical protein
VLACRCPACSTSSVVWLRCGFCRQGPCTSKTSKWTLQQTRFSGASCASAITRLAGEGTPFPINCGFVTIHVRCTRTNAALKTRGPDNRKSLCHVREFLFWSLPLTRPATSKSLLDQNPRSLHRTCLKSDLRLSQKTFNPSHTVIKRQL